jgi:AcrR family transcriptional regulator
MLEAPVWSPVALPQTESPDTKERILAAAGRLFGARGLAGTSLRSITAAAGVNVAAVHYHFGGRERLARAVFARSVAPVNEERLRRLAALEGAGVTPGVASLLRALIEPAFAAAARDPGLAELGALLLAERAEDHAALVSELFGEVMRRFGAALQRSLPALPPGEVHDRLAFAVGAFVHVLSGRAPARPDASAPAADSLTQERLVRFLAAGFAAPSEIP